MKQDQNQYPIFNNQNEPLTFDQIGNTENTYSSKEEEVRIEINTAIRLGFIRKVYGILSFQLLMTTLFCLYAMNSQSLKEYMLYHRGIMYLMFMITFVISIIASCCSGLMRQVPLNYILLFAFTFGESYIVAFICAYTNPQVVLMAAVMTFVMVVSLTLYAINTKNDITMQGGFLFIFTAAVLLFIIFGFFTSNRLYHVIIALVCVILFSLYLIYDTQLIMGNRQEMIQVDDYILGALYLYIDIIQILLNLLQVLNYFSDS
jgi:FtsH-binding integral membrane protein